MVIVVQRLAPVDGGLEAEQTPRQDLAEDVVWQAVGRGTPWFRLESPIPEDEDFFLPLDLSDPDS